VFGSAREKNLPSCSSRNTIPVGRALSADKLEEFDSELMEVDAESEPLPPKNDSAPLGVEDA